MSRWKPLPAELDPSSRQLVIRLRRLKDRAGLSLTRLADRTGYSAKSWERYLGGGTLPPPEAVRALAHLTGTDPVPLLALQEIAAANRASDRGRKPAAPGVAPEDGAEGHTDEGELTVRVTAEAPASRAPRALRIALVACAVAAVLALLSAVLLAVRLRGGDGGPAAARPVSATAPATASARSYSCHPHRADGRWYAGNSRTRRTEVAYGSVGPEVAEAQCLLRRAGISPGGIDGIFGPLTQRAVKDLQKRSGLVVDGRVGPHTWKALRG
ncbi:peptidoglycan-binding protein [Streptomyces sp. NBC_00670]|jgi:transcriptional regulator with XRE-family HTH domain|uniref:peptidoglycan-binding protein n=1 Tax=Streptomyces sp. NBC_00670 TaxID=2975804 RepID=UPI002E3793C1|nr:peptidoglycan-binding protein [Streptomyces sp. NBC_00670]